MSSAEADATATRVNADADRDHPLEPLVYVGCGVCAAHYLAPILGDVPGELLLAFALIFLGLSIWLLCRAIAAFKRN